RADAARADGIAAANVPAGAAVRVVGIDGDADAGALGVAGRADAGRGDARTTAPAGVPAGAAARRVAGQVDAALAAGRVRRGAAAHARSRLAERGGARANVAARTAVLGIAVEQPADAVTDDGSGRAAALSIDAGLAAAAGVVAAAAMVRIGRDQDARVAAARL